MVVNKVLTLRGIITRNDELTTLMRHFRLDFRVR